MPTSLSGTQLGRAGPRVQSPPVGLRLNPFGARLRCRRPMACPWHGAQLGEKLQSASVCPNFCRGHLSEGQSAGAYQRPPKHQIQTTFEAVHDWRRDFKMKLEREVRAIPVDGDPCCLVIPGSDGEPVGHVGTHVNDLLLSGKRGDPQWQSKRLLIKKL